MNNRNIILLYIIMLKETHAKVRFCRNPSGSRDNCILNPESRQAEFEKAEQSEQFSIDIYFILL